MSRSRPTRAVCVAAALWLLISAPSSAGSRVQDAPKKLYPNLVALAPFEVYVEEGLQSCDTYETAEDGAHRCLRYDTAVANFGSGPLELRFRIDRLTQDQAVYQRIYKGGGGFQERLADAYEFHPTHGHLHYKSFSMAKLWKADATGNPVGEEPLRTSEKAGFCIFDSENYWDGRDDSRPQTYTSENSCRPTDIQGSAITQVSGLSPGWMDAYQASLTGQYIEISGVPGGQYVLEIILDPQNTLRESNESDNSVWVAVELPSEPS